MAAPPQSAGWLCFPLQIVRKRLLELLHGFGEDSLVQPIRDKTALLAPEEVARTADVEVAHGDLDAAAEVAELLNRLEAFAAFIREQTQGGERR